MRTAPRGGASSTRVARAIASTRPRYVLARLRVTVQAVSTTDNTVTLMLSDGVTVAGMRYLDSYTPGIGDVVEALDCGEGDIIVLGTLA